MKDIYLRSKKAKLTADQVLVIRSSKQPQATLARQYQVNPTTIRNIIDGTSYKWVG